MSKLLIVDDEPNVLYSLQAGLESDELTVATAKTARLGLAAVGKERPDVVILDVRLPDLSGLELFERIKELDPHLPVIVATAFAETDTAIEAMKRGAYEYLLKPVDLHHLREVVAKAIELRRIRTVTTQFDQETDATSADRIVGQSPVMQEVYKGIGRFAPQDVTVLILGESGTGKELVARALFQHSKRAEKPFLAINCAAIPENLLESELFGHEKGAFTGADRQRIGKFEQADGGTLFLDEIGDMAPATQAKVLRVLQDQMFERVGGQEPVTVNVRLIAATNQKLDELVVAGRFREDLLYRLNGVTVTLPPLRERPDDVPHLVNHFINLANAKLDKQVRTVTPEAMRVLVAYPWPGNVRELQNAVRYAVIRAVSEVITPECLPVTVSGQSPSPNPGTAKLTEVHELVRSLLSSGATDIYRKVIHEVDRVVLGEALLHAHNNQVHASELLGISRTTLRAKLTSIAKD
ncbi:MAG TPA: sigma-54 dependent transcriptional regulator [Fimbriiglobus sp.]